MKYLPSVTKAKYVEGFVIELVFDDGTKKAVDFTEWLHGEVFKPVRKKAFFKKFFLDGSTVAWPNGADIAPETLYAASGVKGGHNKPLDLTPQKRRKSA